MRTLPANDTRIVSVPLPVPVRRSFWRPACLPLLFVLAFALILPGLAVPAVARLAQVTIHVTDWGINQPYSAKEKTGDDFSVSGNKDLFPAMPSDAVSRLLLPMASDDDIRRMNPAQLRQYVMARLGPELMRRLEAAEQGEGPSDFEIQLVQNVNTITYFSGSANEKDSGDKLNKQDLV